MPISSIAEKKEGSEGYSCFFLNSITRKRIWFARKWHKLF